MVILHRQTSTPTFSNSTPPQPQSSQVRPESVGSMEMSYGTTAVELQPPWAGELLARNRKVARNIWSTSDLSQLEILQIEKVVGVSPWTSASESPNTSREDASNQSRNHGGYADVEANLRSIDPVGGSSAKAAGAGGTSCPPPTQQTDKSSPMTSNNNAAKGSKNKLLRGQRNSNGSSSSDLDFNNSSEYYDCKSSFDDGENEEESILEYGPGIVRKLRSKYQSLAVRQTSARPSLWRSASLENCLENLELDQQPQLREEHVRSPSPTPPPRQGKIYTKNMTQNIVEHTEKSGKPRGRTAATKAEMVAKNNATNRSDKERLRRARSVDALQSIVSQGTADASRSTRRRNQQEIDEDILEKCKTVVTPKEEIVIIEMSKPSHISTTGAALLRLSSSDKGKLQLFNGNNGYYYRNNSTTKNYFNANNKANSTSFDSSGLVRGEPVGSPVHELPPHDIVRETARLFEIHNNNCAGGYNNWRKVVGQALRLTNNNHVNGKVPDDISSIESSSRDTTPVPVPAPVITPAVSASSPMPRLDKEITKGSSTNSTLSQVPTTNVSTTPAPVAKNTVSGKQIGIIRPTVNGFKLEDNALSKASPGLSPIIMNPSLAKGKPPLSPKPVNLFYTSSPKSLLSNSNNANASATRVSENENNNANANEKTETHKPLPPKPGPRLFLNANKNKPAAEPLANVNTLMQNNNGMSKNSSGLHQNGNDVIRTSSPDKHVSTSLKSEESESKPPHFASVSLKPVPLVVSSTVSGSSAGNAGIAKGSQINANTAVQDKEALKENRSTTINNASKPSSKPATGSSVPSTMLTDSSASANGSSPSPRSSPTDETLPFLQAKSKLKRQQHVNNTAREEILNSNNNNATTVSSGNVRNDKNANVEANNSQSKPKTTIEFKPKAREPEAETKKIVTAPAQVEEVPPPLPSSPIPRAKLVNESFQTQPPSQPDNKPRKTATRGNDNNDGIMVFNFTKSRTKVPDYLEDEGLGHDDTDSSYIDPKLIHFVGSNIIINGKSSIQKRPKSKKLNISFNEAATTTFEYPSETSILNEDDGSESRSNPSISVSHSSSGILGQKTPNGIHGSVGGLGSYTPSKGSPSLYQLGTYKEKLVDAGDVKKAESGSDTVADDYLRPDTETTTWSNEIGAADILF